MNFEKFTQKSLEAVQAADRGADDHGNQVIECAHLLYALLTAEGGLIPEILAGMNIDIGSLVADCERELATLPKVSGGSRYFSPEC